MRGIHDTFQIASHVALRDFERDLIDRAPFRLLGRFERGPGRLAIALDPQDLHVVTGEILAHLEAIALTEHHLARFDRPFSLDHAAPRFGGTGTGPGSERSASTPSGTKLAGR